MNLCNECNTLSPETESPPPTERDFGREQVVEQVNALTSHEDKPCGSPEPKLSLPMRDPWGTEILQDHRLHSLVPQHTAEPSKPETDSCTGLLDGQSSRHQSGQASDTQEKARSGKKRASLKRRGSTDLSEIEKDRHERRKASNRKSAAKSRQNKAEHIEKLEKEVKGLKEADGNLHQSVLEGENEMVLVQNQKIAMERDRCERQVLEVTDEAQRRSQAMREDLISLIRHHRKFYADLGVPDPSFHSLDTEFHSWCDQMQQNEGNLNAFDSAATPEELLGPREEAFQDMPLEDMDILLPSQSTLDLLLLDTERWGVELGWR